MRKFRIIIICVSVVAIIVFLIIFDNKNLNSKSNLGFFLGIIVAICNILTMIFSNRNEVKNKLN